MVHTVYRTTNGVNGRYYIGVHKTEDPNDDYLGSGTVLKRAVTKYGVGNFTKEVLFLYDNAEEAFQKEDELIQVHRGNPDCYNLRKGGSGGFDYINRVGLNGNNFKTPEVVRKGAETLRRRFNEDVDYRTRCSANARRLNKFHNPEQSRKAQKVAVAAWRGSHHTESTIKRMSEHSTQVQVGTRWVARGDQYKKIPGHEFEQALREGWIAGKTTAPRRNYPPNPPRLTVNELAPSGSNWCGTHKQYLPLSEFHRDARRLSGYKSVCIACRKAGRRG